MVRRAVSSRPPERPWRGGGANWVGPEDHLEPADRLATYFFLGVPSRSAFSFIRSSLMSHCCGMLAMLLTA